MELLVGYIVFVVVSGIFANQRGRNPILWGLIATVISPIGAGIILALLPDIAKLEEQSARELAEQKNRIEQENKEREIKETSITGGEILKKITKLVELKESGIFSEKEFTAAKASFLAEVSTKCVAETREDFLSKLIPLVQAESITQEELILLKRLVT